MHERNISDFYIQNFLQQVIKVSESNDGAVDLGSVQTPQADLLMEHPNDPNELEDLNQLGLALLKKVAVIKLNGGRSTTMGGNVPKCVLLAKNGYSYLEIICRQIECFRRLNNCDTPLVLMNSFFTNGPTLDLLSRIQFEAITFVQNRVPRLLTDKLIPLDLGNHEDWAPPGHGDIFESLVDSGVMQRLLDLGIKWAFISNLDNLAATIAPWILGIVAKERIQFLLEVTPRTLEDCKGGTLVVRNDALELVEMAQVSEKDRSLFMDIQKFRVFNTNNVWVDLETTNELLASKRFDLPIIQNRKTIGGYSVLQLETAMGAAIGSFELSRGLIVGRDRFFPTKRIEDLFVLQSDACVLDSEFNVRRNPKRAIELSFRPTVKFHSSFLNSPLEFSKRFESPSSVSLVKAEVLTVCGNVFFEHDVSIEGTVSISAKEGEYFRIPAGSVLKTGVYP
ncbi:MAG: UTP--glucose-1-phosphate uridylyltransferase, partial [Desulfomonilaceae bacterium]